MPALLVLLLVVVPLVDDLADLPGELAQMPQHIADIQAGLETGNQGSIPENLPEAYPGKTSITSVHALIKSNTVR